MSNKTLVIVLVVVLALAALAFFFYFIQKSTPPKAPESGQPQASTTPPVAEERCVRNFDPERLKATPSPALLKSKLVDLEVKDFGTIRVELYPKDAPKTVENFLRLTDAKYYDCVTFHRVAKGFVIQAGDPTGTGAGGQSAFGREFEDELSSSTPSFKEGYQKGVLAMANRGPNTNTSQFFIMLEDVPLPPNYTIFGKVTEGLDVVERIGQVEIVPNLQMNRSGTDGKPKTPVVIRSARVVEAEEPLGPMPAATSSSASTTK